MATNKYGVVQKNWLTAFMLSLFFGWLGADRFYLGKAGTAVLKLLTFSGFGIWAIIDFALIATESMKGVEWVSGNTKKDKKLAWVIFGVTVAVGLIMATAISGGTGTDTTTNSSPTDTETAQTAESKPAENRQPDVPTEYKSALEKAGVYANTMDMSKQGVYDQLVSKYGEKFSPKAAKYAINNVTADWKANALAKAKTYQEDMSMSPASIRDQLTSNYGEKFTQAEADYAMKHLNK